ncbi:response regulator [Adhaeribacter aerolatus]|uniref:Response regulator n=1 Tax=Adhaeribacter aerolatus TaxID=670289 RepID=A0A512B374_9BACT|nr:response regulator [Adhaeribacter aerolatus]GEO06237.1 response regulator [Adhaeribacter aerolatus]
MDKLLHNILLVDDNLTTISLNKLLIAKVENAVELHTAPDGKAALELLQKLAQEGTRFPDIILVDLKMPVMDGIEFYRHYKQVFTPEQVSNTKVVMLTTSLAPSDFKQAKDEGIEYFLNKPLTTTKLKEILV